MKIKIAIFRPCQDGLCSCKRAECTRRKGSQSYCGDIRKKVVQREAGDRISVKCHVNKAQRGSRLKDRVRCNRKPRLKELGWRGRGRGREGWVRQRHGSQVLLSPLSGEAKQIIAPIFQLRIPRGENGLFSKHLAELT